MPYLQKALPLSSILFFLIYIYIAASGLIKAYRLSCLWHLGSLGQTHMWHLGSLGQTHIPCTARRISNTESPGKPLYQPFSTQAKSLIIILNTSFSHSSYQNGSRVPSCQHSLSSISFLHQCGFYLCFGLRLSPSNANAICLIIPMFFSLY